MRHYGEFERRNTVQRLLLLAWRFQLKRLNDAH
jgi:hypothetical protein